MGALGALLAGITVGKALDALVSSDKAFGDVADLPVVAPGSRSFESPLRGPD